VPAAIAFDEPDPATNARRLDEFTRLISSNLLEAELQAARRAVSRSLLVPTVQI